MKKFTAMASILFLSSALLAGCTNNAAPDRNAADNYDTTRGGRVMDLDNNRNNARMQTRGVDQDRLGVRDNIGPDRGVDQDRLGVRDNIGPDRGPNMRQDRALEARVERLAGIRDATVLVAGNTAYVTINQGTNVQGNGQGQAQSNATNRGGITGLRGVSPAPSQYGGTMSDRDITGTRPNTYAAPGTVGSYGTGANKGTTYYNNTGTSGTAGTGTTGIGATGGAGTAGNTAGAGAGGPGGTYGPNGTGMAPFGTGTTGIGASRFGVNGINNGAGTYNTRNNAAGNTGTANQTGRARGFSVYGDNTINNDVKTRVADAVRQANANIQTVYVSANPALMNRFNAFVRDTATGHPLRGGNDLLDSLRRIFPAAR